MSQNYNWPASGASVSIPAVGPNGQPIPTSSILVGGENPSGNLSPLMTDANGDLIVSPLTNSSVVKAQLQDNSGNGITSTAGALDINLKTSSITLPVSVASLPLPAGAATSANQTTEITTLGSILLDLTNGSQITQITGTVPLPTGAATSSLQTSGNASLTTIATNTTGAATAANQTNVQSAAGTSATTLLTVQGSATGVAIPTSVASLPLPAGAATSALQTSGNASLTTIATNTTGVATAANQATEITSLSTIATNTGRIPAQGQAAMAASTPVAIASNQSAIPASAATPTARTITQAAITVGTTAVRLTVSGSAPSATRVVLVANPDAASTAKFYIGSSSVTSTGATRGAQVVAGQSFIANNDAGDYYIVSDTAAQTVEVMEQA